MEWGTGADCGGWSAERKQWSVDCWVGSVHCRVIVECRVVECRVWSVKCLVRSAECSVTCWPTLTSQTPRAPKINGKNPWFAKGIRRASSRCSASTLANSPLRSRCSTGRGARASAERRTEASPPAWPSRDSRDQRMSLRRQSTWEGKSNEFLTKKHQRWLRKNKNVFSLGKKTWFPCVVMTTKWAQVLHFGETHWDHPNQKDSKQSPPQKTWSQGPWGLKPSAKKQFEEQPNHQKPVPSSPPLEARSVAGWPNLRLRPGWQGTKYLVCRCNQVEALVYIKW